MGEILLCVSKANSDVDCERDGGSYVSNQVSSPVFRENMGRKGL